MARRPSSGDRFSRGERRAPPPLDPAGLEALALRYVERFATTRGKLAHYLRGKIARRGWTGDAMPDPEGLADTMAARGYIDDRGFADARAASLVRRGYGTRRVTATLRAAGVDEDDRAGAEQLAEEGALAAALALARRRRIGPFAAEPPDRAGRERAIAILLRAGHGSAISRRIADARPGETIERDEDG